MFHVSQSLKALDRQMIWTNMFEPMEVHGCYRIHQPGASSAFVNFNEGTLRDSRSLWNIFRQENGDWIVSKYATAQGKAVDPISDSIECAYMHFLTMEVLRG